MKKIDYIKSLLMAVLFYGCEMPDYIVKEDSELIIYNIEISNTKKAQYTIINTDNLTGRTYSVVWTDSIGKFQVGDTVTITKKIK